MATSIGFGAGKDKPGTSKIEFNRDVRALLSDNCFACHGPDEEQRKAKLRLDVKEDAFKPA
ncbi:MAG TPA: c-type cytochrome domain-containing protein, partial [Methylomirabilota bacterium]|nr:c-type cytochrome domain-containing protein [Methylomirabilota bacterium]